MLHWKATYNRNITFPFLNKFQQESDTETLEINHLISLSASLTVCFPNSGEQKILSGTKSNDSDKRISVSGLWGITRNHIWYSKDTFEDDLLDIFWGNLLEQYPEISKQAIWILSPLITTYT